MANTAVRRHHMHMHVPWWEQWCTSEPRLPQGMHERMWRACAPQVGAVVVGFDRHLNYYKIQYATLCISENPGCHFIATNLDAKTHLTDAQEWAGNGSMVGAIKGACPGPSIPPSSSEICRTTASACMYKSCLHANARWERGRGTCKP